MQRGENGQLRMHCNLRPPEPRQSFSALRVVTKRCQVWSRWTYPLPYYSVFATDTLLYDVTLNLWPWPLTFDLEHLQCISCDVMKLCTKFERNQAIRDGVIAISIFDLMTLTSCNVFRSAVIIFTKFDLRQLIRAWILAFYVADTFCVPSRCDLDLWPFDLELLHYFQCHVFKLCTKLERNGIIHGWVIDYLARFRRAFLRGGTLLPNGSHGCVDQHHQTWQRHRAIIHTQESCFSVQISCCIFER